MNPTIMDFTAWLDTLFAPTTATVYASRVQRILEHFNEPLPSDQLVESFVVTCWARSSRFQALSAWKHWKTFCASRGIVPAKELPFPDYVAHAICVLSWRKQIGPRKLAESTWANVVWGAAPTLFGREVGLDGFRALRALMQWAGVPSGKYPDPLLPLVVDEQGGETAASMARVEAAQDQVDRSLTDSVLQPFYSSKSVDPPAPGAVPAEVLPISETSGRPIPGPRPPAPTPTPEMLARMSPAMRKLFEDPPSAGKSERE